MTLRNNQKDTVVIAGAGIAGLTLAIDLITKDPTKHIVMVEKREDVDYRLQLVHLKDETRFYYLSLIKEAKSELSKEDQIFKKQLEDKKEHVAIKDLQRFLKRRLNEKGKCQFYYNSQITHIDFKTKNLTVSTSGKSSDSKSVAEHKIPFADITDATGTSRSVGLNFLTPQVEYKETFKSKYKNIMSCYLRVKKKDGSEVELPDRILSSFNIGNVGYGYVYFNRSSHQKSEAKQLKFYVTTSIDNPANYADFKENPEEGVKFLKHIASFDFSPDEYDILATKYSRKYDLEESKKEGNQPEKYNPKEQLKLQFFERIFYAASVAGLEIEGVHCYLAADAHHSPDFYQGIGANSACAHAREIADCILGRTSLAVLNLQSQIRLEDQLFKTKYSVELKPKLLNFKQKMVYLTSQLKRDINEQKTKFSESKNGDFGPQINSLEEFLQEIKNYETQGLDRVPAHIEALLERRFVEIAIEIHKISMGALEKELKQAMENHQLQLASAPDKISTTSTTDIMQAIKGPEDKQKPSPTTSETPEKAVEITVIPPVVPSDSQPTISSSTTQQKTPKLNSNLT